MADDRSDYFNAPIGVGPIWDATGRLKYPYPKSALDAMRYDSEAVLAWKANQMEEYERLLKLHEEALARVPDEWAAIKLDPDWNKRKGDPTLTPDVTKPRWRP